jgi:hypothetical protein
MGFRRAIWMADAELLGVLLVEALLPMLGMTAITSRVGALSLLRPIPWRQFGCDASRLRQQGELAIPLTCLAIWPVLSLRCYIGHADQAAPADAVASEPW